MTTSQVPDRLTKAYWDARHTAQAAEAKAQDAALALSDPAKYAERVAHQAWCNRQYATYGSN